MDALSEDRWAEAFPWLTRTRRSFQLQRLLESAEKSCLTSAAQLRASGKRLQADRAQQFAARVRQDLEQPKAARWLYDTSRELRDAPDLDCLLGVALDRAIWLLSADRGNVQLLDPGTGELRIAAQHHLSAEFLEYFAVVNDTGSACGRAATDGCQIVITDVDIDAGFAPHRDIAAATGFRAVQSTPLIDGSGQLRGVLSTHYTGPHSPPRLGLQLMLRLAQLIADKLAVGPAASAPLEPHGSSGSLDIS
jgi:hypothetical protein